MATNNAADWRKRQIRQDQAGLTITRAALYAANDKAAVHAINEAESALSASGVHKNSINAALAALKRSRTAGYAAPLIKSALRLADVDNTASSDLIRTIRRCFGVVNGQLETYPDADGYQLPGPFASLGGGVITDKTDAKGNPIFRAPRRGELLSIIREIPGDTSEFNSQIAAYTEEIAALFSAAQARRTMKPAPAPAPETAPAKS